MAREGEQDVSTDHMVGGLSVLEQDTEPWVVPLPLGKHRPVHSRQVGLRQEGHSVGKKTQKPMQYQICESSESRFPCQAEQGSSTVMTPNGERMKEDAMQSLHQRDGKRHFYFQ